MGQDTSKFGFPSTTLVPGTYHIINASAKTLLESPDYDRQKVIGGAPRPDSKHQQWFVQRVGKGYQFKNCHSGTYLTAQTTDISAPVCASEYPMSWVLHLIQGEDTFVVQIPMNDRVLNLRQGEATDGTKINIRAVGDLPEHRKWRFERISDESDTIDIEGLKRDLASKTQEVSTTGDELGKCRDELEKCREELAGCRDELAQCRSELAESRDGLAKSRDELAKCQGELAKSHNELANCRAELAEKEQASKQDSEKARSEVAELGGRGGPLGSLKRIMKPKGQRDT